MKTILENIKFLEAEITAAEQKLRDQFGELFKRNLLAYRDGIKIVFMEGYRFLGDASKLDYFLFHGLSHLPTMNSSVTIDGIIFHYAYEYSLQTPVRVWYCVASEAAIDFLIKYGYHIVFDGTSDENKAKLEKYYRSATKNEATLEESRSQ